MDLLKKYQQLTLALIRLINAPRNDDTRLRKALVPPKTLQIFLECAQLAAERNLAMGVQPEMSVRLEGGKILITKSKSWFLRLSDQDLVIASLTKNEFGDHERLPPYVACHRAIYQTTNARAIFYSNSPIVAAFASTDEPSEPLSHLQRLGGVIRVSFDVQIIASAAQNHPVFLVDDNGLWAVGDTLYETLAHAEMTAYWCRRIISTIIIQHFGGI